MGLSGCSLLPQALPWLLLTLLKAPHTTSCPEKAASSRFSPLLSPLFLHRIIEQLAISLGFSLGKTGKCNNPAREILGSSEIFCIRHSPEPDPGNVPGGLGLGASALYPLGHEEVAAQLT